MAGEKKEGSREMFEGIRFQKTFGFRTSPATLGLTDQVDEKIVHQVLTDMDKNVQELRSLAEAVERNFLAEDTVTTRGRDGVRRARARADKADVALYSACRLVVKFGFRPPVARYSYLAQEEEAKAKLAAV